MAKYRVVRPWQGVRQGQIVEIALLHRAIKDAVEPVESRGAVLTPATPPPVATDEDSQDQGLNKAQIAARLRDLGVEFDGRASRDALLDMLREFEDG